MSWISVGFRLPKYDTHFLAYTECGLMHVQFFWAATKENMFGRKKGGMSITHWMPLPEPPKVGL